MVYIKNRMFFKCQKSGNGSTCFLLSLFCCGFLIFVLGGFASSAQQEEDVASSVSGEGENPSSPPRFKGKQTGVEISQARPEDITPENYPNIIESFVFPNADLKDVIKAMSTDLNINIIMSPELAGKKISIISYSPITVAEAYQAFLSALALHGLTVTRSGSFLKIVPSDQALKSSPIYQGKGELKTDHFVTRIFKLKHIQAQTLKNKIKPFIDSKAVQSLIFYEPSNMVIISGHGLNVEKTRRIILALDVPSQENNFKVLPVKHAVAKTLAETIGGLLQNMSASSYRSYGSRRGRNKGFQIRQSKINISSLTHDERTNSLIVMGNAAGIKKVEDLVAQLDYYQDPELAGGIFVYKVKHGSAEELAKTLNTLFGNKSGRRPSSKNQKTGSFTPPGVMRVNKFSQMQNVSTAQSFQDIQITPEKNTNSLLIVANKYNYENTVLNLLKEVDISRNQVFVKAIIMEMNTDKNTDWKMASYWIPKGSGGVARMGYGMGDNLLNTVLSTSGATLMFPLQIFKHIGSPGKILDYFNKKEGGGYEGDLENIEPFVRLKTGQLSSKGASAVAASPSGSDSQAPEGEDSSDSRGGGGSVLPLRIPSLAAFIRFLQTTTGGNILSNPQVIALDHQEALISIKERIPIIGSRSTGGLQNALQSTANTDHEEIKTELKITPHINPDINSVRLDLEQNLGNITDQANIPQDVQNIAIGTKTRTLKTSITLKNGETAVLGGLLTAENTSKASKIPVLGDIPIIGSLFKNSEKRRKKNNMILFITPHIIRSAHEHKHILSQKLKDRMNFIRQFTNKDPFAGLTAEMLKQSQTEESTSPEEEKSQQEETQPPALSLKEEADFVEEDTFIEEDSPASEEAEENSFEEAGEEEEEEEEFLPEEEARHTPTTSEGQKQQNLSPAPEEKEDLAEDILFPTDPDI